MRIYFLTNSLRVLSDAQGPPQALELTGVVEEYGQLYAVLRAEASERIIRIEASHLASFAAFQQRIENELGVPIVADNERHPTVRGRAWSEEVERARARGSYGPGPAYP
jgi:hypothetical protein